MADFACQSWGLKFSRPPPAISLMNIQLISDEAMKSGVSSVVNDIYTYMKGRVSEFVTLRNAEEHSSHLYEKLYGVLSVKTLLHPEREVNLLSFYYPTTLRTPCAKAIHVNSLADFGGTGGIIVEGLAGQGKSVLLRYLTAKEMQRSKSIPVFVELRRIRERTLYDLINDELRALGFTLDANVLHVFYKTGKITLLLDAFDECPENRRQEVVESMELLLRSYSKLLVVISSRPNSGIETSSAFRTYKVNHLKSGEYIDVLRCIVDDANEYDAISQRVKEVPKLAEVLTTPLMVTLLVIHFWNTRDVPSSLIAFYADLFDVLIRRHNRDERGAKRSSRSGLDNRQLRQLFGALCFQCRKTRSDDDILRVNLEDLGATASTLIGLNCQVSNAVSDIITVTNLIVEEGGYCRFIHKTIKEYHSAAFLARADGPDDVGVVQFYQSLFTQREKWRKWQGELYYLSMIDEYRFRKYFLIPNLQAVVSGGIEFLFEFADLHSWVDVPFGGTLYLSFPDLEMLTRIKGWSWQPSRTDLCKLVGQEVMDLISRVMERGLDGYAIDIKNTDYSIRFEIVQPELRRVFQRVTEILDREKEYVSQRGSYRSWFEV